MPQIEVDPKLERRLDNFLFDEPRFALALAEMEVPDERIKSLNVVFSGKRQILQGILGRMGHGVYSVSNHRITLFPHVIGSNSSMIMREVPASWPEATASTLATRCDLVLAHESKHVADFSRDHFLDAWNEKLATDIERISSLAACMSFGATAAALYVLDLASTPNENAGLNLLEKSAEDFIASPQAPSLFDGIVSISFR